MSVKDIFPEDISVFIPEKIGKNNCENITIFKNIYHSYLIIDTLNKPYTILSSSEGFYNLTGYTSKEIVGKDVDILEGYETTDDSIEKIEESLLLNKELDINIIYYRKNRTTFLSNMHIIPSYNSDGIVVYFIAFQKEISKELFVLSC